MALQPLTSQVLVKSHSNAPDIKTWGAALQLYKWAVQIPLMQASTDAVVHAECAPESSKKHERNLQTRLTGCEDTFRTDNRLSWEVSATAAKQE